MVSQVAREGHTRSGRLDLHTVLTALLLSWTRRCGWGGLLVLTQGLAL